jgi:hypothetical protein
MQLATSAKGVQTDKGVPVRMVWKAPSTFEASSADVSMKDKPFSAVNAVNQNGTT